MILPKISVKRPVAIAMLFMAVLLFGLVSLTRLPLDVMPEMELPSLTVITIYPGASAIEVEQQVTRKLESILGATEGLKEISSQSKENVSFISLQFDWGTDINASTNSARDLMELVRKDLPSGATNPVIYKINSSLLPVLIYGVTAQESFNGLDRIIEDQVAGQLRKLPGVGSVVVLATPKREIKVEVDPQKLKAYDIAINQISTILQAENITIPGGNIMIGENDFAIRIPGDIEEIKQLEDIALINFNNKVIRLKDVATITDGYRESDEHSRSMHGKGVGIMVQRQTGENTLAVTRAVRKKLKEIQKTLPADVSIDEVMNSDELIVESIKNLSKSLWYALIFVVIIVFAFLREWRLSFIVFLTIPFSLITAFILMFALGWTINIFSLMSLIIAMGMVVDNAIVVLENITQHIEKGLKPIEAAVVGTSEMGQAITASTLTTLMVFIPMIFMGGIVGVMFKQLAILTSVTMIASLFAALTLTPMASSLLLAKRKKQAEQKHFLIYRLSEKFFVFLEEIYRKTLVWAVRHKTFSLMATLAVLVVSLWVGKGLGTDYIPEFDAGDLVVVIETEIGSTAAKTDSIAQIVMDIVKREVPELTPGSLSAISGQSEDGVLTSVGFREGKNLSTILGHLTLPNERSRSAKQIAHDLRPHLSQIPEIVNFNIIGGSIISQAVTGNVKPIEYHISGGNYEQLNAIADSLTANLQKSSNFIDVVNTVDKGKLEIQVKIDRQKASAMGLNSAMIGLQVRQSIYGADAGAIKEEGNDFSILVKYGPEYVNDIEKIKNISLTNLFGQQIPLGSVADIVLGTGSLQIDRLSQERVVKVMAELNRVSLGEAQKEAQAILDAAEIPSGVDVTLSGQTAQQGQSFSDLYLIFFLGIALVYMVMAGQFESFRDPFIIMFAVPLTFIGVIWAFKLTGITLSVTTFVGVIMLLGIVVNNGIVLVDYTNQLRKRGMEVYAAIQESGRSRLRPVLMTSLTTILGMLPLALSNGMGREAYQPLGITMIGGLLVSTFITLLVVPTVYATFHKNKA
ncbi:MAG TPA: efflux RND transporter permease subunit [Tenuifilaceae bacterium]|nr:efflux RND transporter permease subunit [Tenuifilaceae bacterium]HPE18916.1 efflux RND transporter permease subunit [Tenuifilaceae bacterium]HPJ44996.1 efflux RND transporter permease subunit [Tenuifilaceae bacterium]HPQ34804.1 efflux RND transporter permease subunit [Tenuifilaceae bacterium]HRX67120.1 efflux RND transporter permease subunit [Tenuifilaceae bacterium]